MLIKEMRNIWGGYCNWIHIQHQKIFKFMYMKRIDKNLDFLMNKGLSNEC
ncbi:uncharacterized protein DS421_20g708160 [Arachis hypogaea]|nr:uncharacterized protein DS421_20g708160 [Arachis hypogaea]